MATRTHHGGQLLLRRRCHNCGEDFSTDAENVDHALGFICPACIIRAFYNEKALHTVTRGNKSVTLVGHDLAKVQEGNRR